LAVARRHHYVPRFYLKAFAVSRKEKWQTTVLDRIERKQFQTAIENVAAERDFNRVELDGIAPDAFESIMAAIESERSPAIERIASRGSFKDNRDRASLLNLIGLTFAQSSATRDDPRFS
jgi:uncharacterized protein DUF4238